MNIEIEGRGRPRVEVGTIGNAIRLRLDDEREHERWTHVYLTFETLVEMLLMTCNEDPLRMLETAHVIAKEKAAWQAMMNRQALTDQGEQMG